MRQQLNVPINWTCAKTWASVLEACRKGEISLTMMQASKEREKEFLFTKSFFSFPYVLIARRTQKQELKLADLSEKRVLVIKGYSIEKYIQEHYPDIRMETVPDHRSGLMKVAFEEDTVFVGDLFHCSWLIETLGISNLRVVGDTGLVSELSLATQKENIIFGNILQKFLNAIPDRKHKEIRDKWVHVKGQTGIDTKSIALVVAAGAVIGGIILRVIFWN